MLLNAKEIFLQYFKCNIILLLFDDRKGVEQLKLGMCFENLGD